jgi:hypothetical protein
MMEKKKLIWYNKLFDYSPINNENKIEILNSKKLSKNIIITY